MFKKKEVKEQAAEPTLNLAAIIEAMSDGIIVTDLDTNIIFLNQAMKNYLTEWGVDPEKYIGKSALDLPILRPEDMEKYMEVMKTVLERGKAGPFEAIGTPGKWTSVTASLLRDEEGKPNAIFAVVRDITKLKRLQEEIIILEKAKAAAETIEAMPDALIVLDLDGKILVTNPAHLKMFGHKSSDEIMGKSFEEMRNAFVNPEEDIPKMLELFREVVEKGFMERPIELKLQRPDGSKQFIVSASGSVIRDIDGKVTSVVAVLRDITELKRAEEERVAAFKRAANLIEAMPIGVDVMDLNGKFLQENETAYKMFGYGKGEALGKPATDFIVEEDVPRALEAIRECIEKGFYKGFECTGIRKDGSKFPIVVDGTLMKDAKGNPSSIVITFRDMTELKRAEEERARALAERAQIVDAMGDGVALLDMGGMIISVNPALIKMCGYEKDEVIGKAAADVMPNVIKPEDMEKVIDGFRTALKGKAYAPIAFNLVSKEGREISVSQTVSFIKDAEGKPTHVIVTFKDITELKRAEEERKEVAAVRGLATIVDGLPDPLVVIDPDATVVHINPAFTELFGDKPEEMIRKNAWECARLADPKDLERVMKRMKDLLESGVVEPLELGVLTKHTNKVVPCSVTYSLLKDTEGNPKYIIATLRDITELRKTMSDLEKAKLELEKRIRDLERFQKVTMDREKRIIELKEKIWELEKKLKEKEE
ncbi:MAG: PAS domain-containing protein [Candidatus Thermoplasmatota archaeon]